MKRFLFLILASLTLATGFAATPLRWGADSEGGAPYSFRDPANPDKLIGFEVDLIEAIGRKLGRPTEFVQNQWDGLIPGLERENYDVVINGLEITEDRKEVVAFSNPYYATYEQLAVRKENNTINSLESCRGKVVGTLKFTVAERILRATPGIDVRSYDGQVNAYEDLANGRLDAVLMDWPIAIYYAVTQPKLKMVGDPIGEMTYGIAIRKKDKELQEGINRALAELGREGEIEKIYRKWGLWNEPTARLFPSSVVVRQDDSAYQQYLRAMGLKRGWWDKIKQYADYLPILLQGAEMTFLLSICAMGLAVSMGLALALIRLYTPFSWLAMIYVEVIRGTPLLIQLFFIFYGLPNIGILLNPWLAAFLGLGLNYAAYESENYRAGIQSIAHSQVEAAYALGMTHAQTLRHVVLPQAIRLVLPPVTNDFISLLKDSSLVSVITMVELTKTYGQLASTYYDYFGIGLMTAGIYLLMGLPFVYLSRWAERYFSAGVRQPQKTS